MITTGTLNRHKALWLENDSLKVTILPHKGADIPELLHKPSGVQFLMKTPTGLQPPGDNPPLDFLDNYEGGWQELFPNHNDACEVNGAKLPMHGEVALLPWEYKVSQEGENRVLHLWVTCRQTPFSLDRWMRLRGNQLEVEGKVTNLSADPTQFVWGQHIVLGGDFLEGGCHLETPVRYLETSPVAYEPATARLVEDQWEQWPMARSRHPGEEWVDLRQVPSPEIHSHDDVFIIGFEHGRLEVTNPRLGLRWVQEWDISVFPWVVLWQPYGGADLPPLTGIYGLGVEPWVSRYNLAGAIAAGQAKTLSPGESLTTQVSIVIESI